MKKQDHLSPDEFGLPPGMILPVMLMINTTRPKTHKTSNSVNGINAKLINAIMSQFILNHSAHSESLLN